MHTIYTNLHLFCSSPLQVFVKINKSKSYFKRFQTKFRRRRGTYRVLRCSPRASPP